MVNQQALVDVKAQIKEAHVKVEEYAAIEKRNIELEFAYRCSVKDKNDYIKQWDQLQEQAKEIEKKLKDLEASPPR